MDYNIEKDGAVMIYEIQKAVADDMPRIHEIYAHARRFMAAHGNPNQWGEDRPEEAQLWEDIRRGDLYTVASGGCIHGVFAFILGGDPTYARIYEGAWHHTAPYGTIHRIAGDGSGGILHACISYCEQVIRHLRIDTHHDNIVMQNAVRKEGFLECGIIYIADGTPRIAYDRLLE